VITGPGDETRLFYSALKENDGALLESKFGLDPFFCSRLVPKIKEETNAPAEWEAL